MHVHDALFSSRAFVEIYSKFDVFRSHIVETIPSRLFDPEGRIMVINISHVGT